METNLILSINDEIHIGIDNFTETIVNIDRGDLSHPEVYATITNADTNLSFIGNITISKLSVSKEDEIIWTSTNYTKVQKLEFVINNDNSHYGLTII